MSGDPEKYANATPLYWTTVMVGLCHCVMLKFNKLNLIATIYKCNRSQQPNLSLEAEEISMPECKVLSLPISGENADRYNHVKWNVVRNIKAAIWFIDGR